MSVAAGIALLTHLSSLLLLPALTILAMTRVRGHGLRWKQVFVSLALAVLLVDVADYTMGLIGLFQSRGEPAGVSTVMLYNFATEYATRLHERGFFGGGEVLHYLQLECWRPSFLLLVLLVPALLLAWRQRVRIATGFLISTALYLAVFTQGGVWERGAYYLSLYPLCAGLLAELLDRCRAMGPRVGWMASGLVVLAGVPQAWYAERVRDDFNHGLTPQEWAAEVERVVPDGAVIYTAELPQYFCLLIDQTRGYETLAVRKLLDQYPREHHTVQGGVWLQRALHELLNGRDVYFDASMFDTSRERASSVESFARVLDEELAKSPALERLPMRDERGRLILYRVASPIQ